MCPLEFRNVPSLPACFILQASASCLVSESEVLFIKENFQSLSLSIGSSLCASSLGSHMKPTFGSFVRLYLSDSVYLSVTLSPSPF